MGVFPVAPAAVPERGDKVQGPRGRPLSSEVEGRAWKGADKLRLHDPQKLSSPLEVDTELRLEDFGNCWEESG